MAFRALPTTIKDPQADAKAINDNFESIQRDLITTGGEITATAAVASGSLTPGGVYILRANINNVVPEMSELYRPGRVITIPRVQVFLDNNNDFDYRWPDGDSLTNLGFGAGTVQQTITVHADPTLETSDSAPNRITSFYVFIRNEDPDNAHTYYIQLDAFLFPTPHDSRFL